MSIDSVASLGTLGIQRGLQGIRESATQIAGGTTGAPGAPGTKDTAAALVALKQHEQQVAASAKVIETADGVIGALLDTFA